MLKILLALLVAVFCWPAQALLLSPQMGLHESASLSGHLSALRDAGGTLSIEDVAAPTKAAEFAALPGFLSAGYTTDTYWLRFTLQRALESTDAWFVEVAPSYLNDVTLFVPRAEGGFEPTKLGDLQAFAARALPHRNFVFPLRLQGDPPLTLYLRVKTASTMLVQVRVWQYPGLLGSAQTDTSLYGVYLGILALGLMTNLMFWFWLRERLYLSYCGYLVMLAVVAMATGGFAAQWLLPHQPLFANRLVGVSVSLIFLLGTNFFVRVLRLREHFARLNWVVNAVLLFYMACVIAAAVGLYGLVVPWMMLMAFGVTLGSALIGPWLLWRGHREYLFYTLAFTANFTAVPLTMAKLMGWVSLPISTDYITGIGSVVHVVLLNFAVVDRVRHSEKKMLTAVKQAAKLAAEHDAVDRQRKFVAMVSHEFRTPLAVIDATAQSVEIACSQSGTASYEFIAPRQEKIRRAVRRMVSLLDNFLTTERLDFHSSEVNCTVTDMRDLASEAIQSWKHLLSNPDQLQLDLCNEPTPVFIDRAMMALALSNLIDNAIKYSPLASPITLRVGKTNGKAWIEVQDLGTGIKAQDLAQIFDKFYRSSDAHTVLGAGLGLYLVRSIAHSVGGEVDVSSEQGKGSRFRITVSLVK